jgi:hypothetical protein
MRHDSERGDSARAGSGDGGYSVTFEPDLRHGDCVELMAQLEPNSIDAIVTDPPYGLEFLGKDWDKLGNMQAWHYAWACEALRVLKPGGYLLAFGGTRTHHRLTCALEDAGFEIRDEITWIQGQGFPKSTNIAKKIDAKKGAKRATVRIPIGKRSTDPRNPKSILSGHGVEGGDRKAYREAQTRGYYEQESAQPVTDEAIQWDGWETGLKPMHEPIIVAQKPTEGASAENVLKYGVGGLNINASRLGYTGESAGWSGQPSTRNNAGRWPGNVILSHSPECREIGTARIKGIKAHTARIKGIKAHMARRKRGDTVVGFTPGGSVGHGDDEGRETVERWACAPQCPIGMLGMVPARFFFCAKASAEQREAGLDRAPSRVGNRANDHPTVKPDPVMQWLVRLVTPPNGLILDPFMGSGTTGRAAKVEGFRFMGMEQDEKYVTLARDRIAAAGGDKLGGGSGRQRTAAKRRHQPSIDFGL